MTPTKPPLAQPRREIIRKNNLTRWRANALWLSLLNGRIISMKLFDSDMINRHGEGGREPMTGAVPSVALAFLSVHVPAVPELGIEAERKNVFWDNLRGSMGFWDYLDTPQVRGPLWRLRQRGKYVWVEPVGHAPDYVLEGMLAAAARAWG